MKRSPSALHRACVLAVPLALAALLHPGCVAPLQETVAVGGRPDIAAEVPDSPPIRGAQPAPSTPRTASPPAVAPTVAPTATLPAPRALPSLDHEPRVDVLLARAPRVVIQLEARAQLEIPGGAVSVGPGALAVERTANGWRFGDDRVVTGPGRLKSGGRPIFRLDALPKFGEPRRLLLGGDLAIHPDGDALLVIEELGLEDYVAGVVAAEINPKWPAAALAAQAIVARSYAAARWMERSEEPWQLHWHFGVDMAYHGWSEQRDAVARSIASTRGEMLMYRGFPVLALFHASSGGRTEAFERVKPGVLGPDDRTPIAAAMPVVEDAAALPGALGLELSATHGCWKTDIRLPDITRALQAWSRESNGRPRFGEVEAVSIVERYPDSGRVATVSVRHRLDGATRYTHMAATEFRLAVSPVRIRSLLWDRCVIASKEPGYLVLEGRGFGHGCGLSQVSAWYLATRGASPEEIVARFYAGARIERQY